MDADGLQAAIARGEPLADITVLFHQGIDANEATDRLNALSDEFYLRPHPWYDDPRMRSGTATREALKRLFGWRIQRAPLPGGTGYWWTTATEPSYYPEGCDSLIESMDLSQPGGDDQGQWFEWPDRQSAEDGDGRRN